MTRKITAVCGALGIIIAYYLASIISAMAIFYSLMTVSLAAPFLLAFLPRRLRRRELSFRPFWALP